MEPRERERKAASSLNLFRRKWGGQRDDSSGAEDAPDPEAGQHCWAEGGLSQEGETLPCVRICGKGQLLLVFQYALLYFSVSRLRVSACWRCSLKLKKCHHGNIWTMVLSKEWYSPLCCQGFQPTVYFLIGFIFTLLPCRLGTLIVKFFFFKKRGTKEGIPAVIIFWETADRTFHFTLNLLVHLEAALVF